MSGSARIMWVIVVFFALAAVLGGALLSTRLANETVLSITLAFTVVAALAGTFGGVVTLLGNRSAARYQQELATKQGEMARDVSRLAELTESSLEEARAQRPEPLVRFLVGSDKEPVQDAVLYRTRLQREIDFDRIVAHERESALATLPREREDDQARALGVEGYLSAMAQASAISSIFTGAGPVTDEERSEFADRVEKYLDTLQTWLREYEVWREAVEVLFVTHLRFENRGRVPARDVVVRLDFPDYFEAGHLLPELHDPPDQPVFQRRTFEDLLVQNRLPIAIPRFTDAFALPPVDGNVSSPRYRDGSVIVEIEIDKLLHGIPEETDETLMLRVINDGEFTIPWQIHAENLADPATGVLTLEVVTDLVEGPPITSLPELLATEDRGDEEHDRSSDPG